MSDDDATMHPCPVPGCRVVRLPFERMMCAGHWRCLPVGLRREVWRAWNNGDVRDWPAYLVVRQRAIEAASPTVEGVRP